MPTTKVNAAILALGIELFGGACRNSPVPPAAPTVPSPGRYVFAEISGNVVDMPSRDHPNTLYVVDVTGPFLGPIGFGIGVAGNDLRFAIDGPAFFEHFPPFTYLEIAGSGGTSVETSSLSTVSIPFSGSFEYCVLKSEMGRYNNCYTTPADQKITYIECLSHNDRMILTRR